MATGFMCANVVRWMSHFIVTLLGLAFMTSSCATEVSLVGLYGGKALVVIDGGRPRTVAVGVATPEGVKLLSVDEGFAYFEIDGHRQRLTVGQHTVSTGSGATAEAKATLTADPSGHFITMGTINGAPTRFLVDTGATMVSMSTTDAARANVDYRQGEPAVMMTANGPVRAWRVMLNSVRVGDIVLNQVAGTVQEGNLPFVLLGMSFLNRTEMRRDGSTMTLKKRF